MRPSAQSPAQSCALAIGGLDPGGGAGVIADLRAFEAAGAFGCAVVALMTVQSTAGLRSATPLSPRVFVPQAREVLRVERVRAMKIGALGSADNARAVARLADANPTIPVVIDTPMRATRTAKKRGASGSRAPTLLGSGDARDAVRALRDALIPRATVLTVNVPEAEALLGARIADVTDAHDAAVALVRLGAQAAIVKGGHMRGATAVDVLAMGGAVASVVELRARRLALGEVHGTGCTFASLIAGRLACAGVDGVRAPSDVIVAAVRWAKRVHHAALARAVEVGGNAAVLRFC